MVEELLEDMEAEGLQLGKQKGVAEATLAGLQADEKRTTAELSAMSAEVTALKAKLKGIRTSIHDTRQEIGELTQRL